MRQASAEQVAMVAGAVLVAIGVLGFVPDVTSSVGAISFAGRGSGSLLLGLFRVSILLNLVHVLAGGVGIALARTERGARRFLTGGGTAFLVLWLLGVVKAGGWIPLDGADNWLHLGLGAGLLGAGYVTARAPNPASG
jgi:Domain of unknown function (DUF4383)